MGRSRPHAATTGVTSTGGRPESCLSRFLRIPRKHYTLHRIMSEQLKKKIIEHLKSDEYRGLKPHKLARELEHHDEDDYPEFREALKDLMEKGRVVLGAGGNVLLPTEQPRKDEFVGTY